MLTLNNTTAFRKIIEDYAGQIYVYAVHEYVDPILSVREVGEVLGISFILVTDPDDPIKTTLNITLAV